MLGGPLSEPAGPAISVRSWPTDLPRAERDEAHAITINKGTPRRTTWAKGKKTVTEAARTLHRSPTWPSPSCTPSRMPSLPR